jgi:hypothetical protein
MRRLAALGFAPLFALAACSDDGGSTATGGGIDAPVLENPGFPVPTAVTKANEDRAARGSSSATPTGAASTPRRTISRRPRRSR